MASKAFLIYPDGTRKLVNAAEYALGDRDNKCICAGITKVGELCEAPVRLADTVDPKKAYFFIADRTVGHKPGCSFCRARAASIVETLDRSGKNITIGALHDRLNRDKLPSKPKGEGPEAGGDTDINEESASDPEQPEESEKKVLSQKRNPRDCRELVELISSLETTNRYADHLVFDLILDERTSEAYKRIGKIPIARPFVVTLRKAIPQAYGIHLESDEWLLKDYWGKLGREFLFIVKLNAEAKEYIWNLSNITPAVKIRIWAIFYPHPTLLGVYVSCIVKRHMICADVTDEVD